VDCLNSGWGLDESEEVLPTQCYFHLQRDHQLTAKGHNGSGIANNFVLFHRR
jgi:hypothetical protein